MPYDVFKNSKKFQSHCERTNYTCKKCSGSIVEIYRKRESNNVLAIFGYYCLRCDKEDLGIIEWAISLR